MWHYRPHDLRVNTQKSFGDYNPEAYESRHASWGSLKSKESLPPKNVDVPRIVRVEALSSRRLKAVCDPWRDVLASDRVLAELGRKSRDMDVVLRNKQHQKHGASLAWLEVRKKQVAQAMATRIEMLREADPQGREDDTYLVALYGDDVADDNMCTATIEEFLSFREANSRFKEHVASWNLTGSLVVDTRGLPNGSSWLKTAEVGDDERDEDVSVVLARAPRSVGSFW